MKKILIAGLLCLTFLLGACDPGTPTPGPTIAATWIDAPETNSTIDLGPYLLVFHSASQVGMDVFELRVDNTLIASVPPKTTGSGGSQGTLFMADYEWHPPEPGVYLIEVKPKGTDNQYGPAALAEVTVVEISSAEVLSLELPAPALVVTTPPVPILAPTPTYTPVPAEIGPFLYSSEKVFYRGFGCGSKELEIQLQVNHPATYSVVLFTRLENMDSGEKTEWNAIPLNNLGSGKYGVSIVPELLFTDIFSMSSAFLHVQVVVTDQGANEIFRTPVDTQVVVERCTR